jgi:hypothetical protein
MPLNFPRTGDEVGIQLVFPDPKNSPAREFEEMINLFVPQNISANFLTPEINV